MPWVTPRTRSTVTAVVAAAVLTLVWTLAVHREPEVSAGREVAGWVLTGVGCAALYWRRSRPVTVAAVTLLCTALYFPLSSRDVPLLLLAFAVALYTVAAEGRFAAAVLLALGSMLAVLFGELGPPAGQRHLDNASLLLLAGWFVGVVAAGYAVRTRQAYLREAEERARAAEREKAAAERERAAAEREKEGRVRQAATEERLRIARELHDVLGHSISLINVQSGAALHRQAKDPSRTDELVTAMHSVRDASRAALRDLRATLGVLRQVDEEAPTTPVAVGAVDIERLAAGARTAGLDVTVDVRPGAEAEADAAEGGAGAEQGAGAGAWDALPPEVALAAYRIVQESLTNAVRHAGASRVAVRIRRAGGDLRLRIEDDGAGAGPRAAGPQRHADGARPGGGSGIEGMAERARALGGVLSARDAVPGPGFVVEARLPLPA